MNIEHEMNMESLSVTITCDYIQGTETQASGPPEMCDAGEPDVVENVKVFVGDVEITSELSESQIEEIEQSVIENHADY